MGTKEGDRRPLTASERRQREMKRKRLKKRKQKKMIRAVILVFLAVLAVAAVVGIAVAAVKLVQKKGGGESRITAQGDTFTIMLDAGHGGADIGLSNELLEEKEVTLEIASKLQVMFENYGYQVVFTRTDDSRLSKEERVSAVNESKADLCVSIHLNYSGDASAAGVETYYKKGSAQSQLLAEKVLEAVAAETGSQSRGSGEGNFTILNDTTIPSVLVEVGYASNSEESASLADDAYRNLAAKGIAKGVIRSLDSKEN